MAGIDGLIESTLLLPQVPMGTGAPALHDGENHFAPLARGVGRSAAREWTHECLHLQTVPVRRQVEVELRVRGDFRFVAMDGADVGVNRDQLAD